MATRSASRRKPMQRKTAARSTSASAASRGSSVRATGDDLSVRAGRFYNQARDAARSVVGAVRDVMGTVSGRDIADGLKRATGGR